ncbi:ABC transporter substrate-binding protein, partial [Bacillus cereus]|nr:ABC transporter substrate-binding protein [Bacillus cereus]
GSGSFDDPGLIQAASEVQTLVDMNAFNKGFNGLSNDEGKSEFMNDKAAMYLMATWELPNFTPNPAIPQAFKDQIGFFKFPMVAGGKGNENSWVG